MFYRLLISLVFIVSCAYADTANEQLQHLLQPVKTIQANFKQTLYKPNGKVLQNTLGRMWVAKPNLFRWSVKQPTEQLLVSNGKTLWVYDIDLEQVTVSSLDPNNTQRPVLLFGSDYDKFIKNYQVKAITSQQYGPGFYLQAIDTQQTFKWMELYFKNKKLSVMVFKDNIGNKATLKFRNVKTNQKIKPSLFVLKPPKGVDVIAQTAESQTQ